MLCFVGTNQGDGYIRQANSMQVNFKNSAASLDINSSSSFGDARQPSSMARVVLAIDSVLRASSMHARNKFPCYRSTLTKRDSNIINPNELSHGFFH